jgi:thiol-disulfide isomerase/thioredoxin
MELPKDEDLKIEGSKLVRLRDTKEVKKLLTSSEPVMVVVYAKWCGHCQAMFDTWRDASNKVDGKAKIYVIEADDYTAKDINGYPSMRIVKNGSAKDYDDSRDVEGIQNALLGTSGGKRSRRRGTRRLGRRVRKTAKRALRRHMPLV